MATAAAAAREAAAAGAGVSSGGGAVSSGGAALAGCLADVLLQEAVGRLALRCGGCGGGGGGQGAADGLGSLRSEGRREEGLGSEGWRHARRRARVCRTLGDAQLAMVRG